MAQIGRVYSDSYTKDRKKYPLIILDIRTITTRKKFTIAVNKMKYPDGVVNENITQGKEDYPDYNIWYNTSARGESLPSVIVGSVRNSVSENGLAYKKARIFDPFLSKHSIYFTLFSVDDDKKIDANHLYNVVAEPYRNMNNTSNQTNQTAVPTDNSSNDSYENISQDEADEMPF